MQPKVLSLLFTVVLMTNFSAIAQTLDKSLETFKQASSHPLNGITSSKTLKTKDPKNLEPKIPQGRIKEIKNLQSMGGVATGGGNRLQSYSVGAQRVADFIKNSKISVNYAIRSVEIFFDFMKSPNIKRDPNLDPETDKRFRSIATKLFAGKVTIYEALQKAILQLQMTGPCLDREGKEVDGSAKDAPTICFSVERLASLSEESAQREIVALVAHEVSHMLGTDESEATMFQHMIRSNISISIIEKLPEQVKKYSRDFKDVLSNAKIQKELAAQGDKQMVCTAASSLQAQLNTLLQTTMTSSSNNGITFLRPQELKALYGTLLKAMNVIAYCVSPNAVYMGFDQAFQGRDEMTLQELSEALSKGNQSTMPVPNWKIRHIQDGNDSLNTELNDIHQALQVISKRI